MSSQNPMVLDHYIVMSVFVLCIMVQFPPRISPYGSAPPFCVVASGATEPARCPVLFLECRPACPAVSRRIRLTGRTVEAVIVRSTVELLGASLMAGGPGFFAAASEGDGVDDVAPLVWTPKGTARLTFIDPFSWAALFGPTGAIMAMLHLRKDSR